MSAGERLPGTPVPMHKWEGHGGVMIAGDTWGDPNGPLVALLHGGGQTRHAWKGAGETLGNSGYYAVAFDARGHGDSDWAATSEDYAADCMVEDLACVTRALGSENPILVGASMGGGVSLLSIGTDKIDAAALVLKRPGVLIAVDEAVVPVADGGDSGLVEARRRHWGPGTWG